MVDVTDLAWTRCMFQTGWVCCNVVESSYCRELLALSFVSVNKRREDKLVCFQSMRQ